MNARSLRWQLTFAMWAASLAAAVFIILGLVLYLFLSSTITYEGDPADSEAAVMDNLEGDQNKSGDALQSEELSEEQINVWSDFFAVLLVALGGSAIGGLVGYRFARRLSRPIEILASTARILSAGDLSARAYPKGRQSSEIEKLTRDFNFMAAELDTAQREQAENASAIAHELRTPVTVLRGRLHGLADGVFELNQSTLNGLIAQTETLTRIIEDLRTLTLARTGRLELSPDEINLSDEAGAVLEAVKPLVEEAGLTVRAELESAPVYADPIRMRQAIGALIENAQRYASDGGELTVRTGTKNDHCFVQVMDRGAGLNNDDAARIFDRFWRVDTSRSRRFGGSGLGLAVVRSICQGHGGGVTYATRPGGGAVFEISIPASKRSAMLDNANITGADAVAIDRSSD